MSAPTTLGLSTSPFSSSFATPAAFLAWNWFYAYCVLSSRTFKQRYGIDHNGNPRQDIDKYGIAAVKEGKMTQEQLDQIRRVEAAGANSVDGYSVFAVSVLFGLIANVPARPLKIACTIYTVARLIYGYVYVFVPDDTWSQFRGIAWWTGNFSCLYLFWRGAT